MDIREKLGEAELLAQLAEESAELAQAALKLRRVLDGCNPTPTTEEVARTHLFEEVADVRNCLFLLISAQREEEIARSQRYKMERWEQRLEDRGW